MQQSDAITRRALLSQAAMAAPVAALAAAGGTALAMDGHPDAALLAAWAGFAAAHHALDHAASLRRPDAEINDCLRVVEVYRTAVEQHRASTVEGFAVQLRYLFAMRIESLDAFKTAIYGEPVSPELAVEMGDYRDRMLWMMAESATRASNCTLGRA